MRSRRAWRYGVASALVGASAVLNSAAIGTLGRHSPFLLYYPPVVAAALFGGLGPGVLATLLSAVSILYFNVAPSHTFKWASPEDALRLLSFVLFGLLLSYLSQILRNQNQILRREMRYLHEEGEERFRLVVQEIRDYAIFMLDRDGVIRSWNAGAQQMKGYQADEIIGQHFSKFYPPEDAAGKPARELALAAEHGRCEDEGWRVRKDGSRFWANAVITAVRTPTGRLIGFAKVTRDLTERRANEEALRASREELRRELAMRARAEEALEKQAAELARSNADLERFAHVASHDLQEPLRMVTSFMQLLQKRYRGKLDAEADEFIGFAVDGATRMKQLITDLLAYSRVSRRPAEASPTDCEAVFQDVVRNLELMLKESQAVVTHDPLPTVLAERSQMMQLLQNLLVNSIKFRGTRSAHVHISARHRGSECVFSVRDNGIGIGPEHRERVFEMFQRLNSRREYAGTGIGLATCKRIIERHGGRIWVESEPGEGSTFFFTLPAGAPHSGKETDLEYAQGRRTD